MKLLIIFAQLWWIQNQFNQYPHGAKPTPTPVLQDLTDPTKMVDWSKAKRVIPLDTTGIVKGKTITIPNSDQWIIPAPNAKSHFISSTNDTAPVWAECKDIPECNKLLKEAYVKGWIDHAKYNQ